MHGLNVDLKGLNLGGVEAYERCCSDTALLKQKGEHMKARKRGCLIESTGTLSSLLFSHRRALFTFSSRLFASLRERAAWGAQHQNAKWTLSKFLTRMIKLLHALLLESAGCPTWNSFECNAISPRDRKISRRIEVYCKSTSWVVLPFSS